MNLKPMTLDQSGMSLLEVLVATVIVVTVMWGANGFVLSIKDRTKGLLTSRSSSIQTQRLVQMLMADPKLFRVNFDPTTAKTCEVLRTEDLPLAWDENNVYPVAECPTCAGRIGFTMQPYPLPIFRGLFVVTFRISHPLLTQGSAVTCNGTSVPNVEELRVIVSLR